MSGLKQYDDKRGRLNLKYKMGSCWGVKLDVNEANHEIDFIFRIM